MAAAGIYLVSVSLCIRVLIWHGTPYDRRRSSQHPIEIHSMDHRASLTSLSYFLPITYITFPRKLQPFFSQFEYIVPSVDIHMYIRPILSLSPFPLFSLSCRSVPSWFLCISPFSLSLSFSFISLRTHDSLSHTYRSFYLANPTGGFVVA